MQDLVLSILISSTFQTHKDRLIARLMVRKLIPAVAPGNTMEDIVDARFDYSQLDSSDSAVRIRLNSTAVNIENVNGGVEVAYVQHGKPFKLKGKNCVLACYNGLIPHLCPELPDKQKENLKYGVKTPLVMTNVLLRSGTAVIATTTTPYTTPSGRKDKPPMNWAEHR